MLLYSYEERKKERLILNSEVRKERMAKRTGKRTEREKHHINLTREHITSNDRQLGNCSS